MQFLIDGSAENFIHNFFTFGNKNLQYIVQQQIAGKITFFHVKNNQISFIAFSSTIKRKKKLRILKAKTVVLKRKNCGHTCLYFFLSCALQIVITRTENSCTWTKADAIHLL